MFWECLLDAVIDTAKVIPILYLVYLLVAYLGHNNNNKYAKLMNKSKRFGPMIGAVAGCVPQCGFSIVMADLYSKKAITIGTLIAVFVATSDEAIPILISEPDFILPMLLLIAIKLVFALMFGYLFDFIMKICGKKQHVDPTVFEKTHNHECDITSCSHMHQDMRNEEHEEEIKSVHTCNENCHHGKIIIKKKELKQEHDHSCTCCADNIFLDALKHTATISLFLLIATLVINLIVEFAGIDNLSLIFGGNKFAQPFVAGLIGLIPSCASSVFLVEFYMAGGITFGAMLSGLTAGAGIGIFVLFARNKKNILSNIIIAFSVYLIGVIAGLIFTYIPLGF